MKKTSIYLPRKLVLTWKRKQRILFARLPALLSASQHFAPTRTRLRMHQRCTDGGVIISVYWPLAIYNKLHSFATATRISVSLLLAYLLERLDKPLQRRSTVLNYGFQVIAWNPDWMAFREDLNFSTIPPPLTP